MCWSQSEMKYSNSIRGEIYEAYPWLGPAQVPAEPDEFVCMAGVVQIDGSHRASGGYRSCCQATAWQWRQRFHYVLKKRSSKWGCSALPRSAVAIPAVWRADIMLDCCNFPASSMLLSNSQRERGFGLQVRKISPRSPNASAQIS